VKPLLFIRGLLSLLMSIGLLAGCTKSKEDAAGKNGPDSAKGTSQHPTKSTLPDPDVSATAEELAREYADEKEASKKYEGGKKLRVVGVVQEIVPENVIGNTQVKLKGAGKLLVSCSFFKDQPAEAARAKALRPGQNVTLQGICVGKLATEVCVELCEFAD
jgi:tRNA_anti-like